MPITHISDTARWVAVYRAQETERSDAIFHDPYARQLAGDHGARIVAAMERGNEMSWAFVVRTAVFDELLLAGIARDNIDLVLNLAAGLDARPWRLTLPPSLRWVDVDLPDILTYKQNALAGELPRCRYEGVAADLTDVARRPALFARVTSGAQRVLVLTEGLLIYLSDAQVLELARDLRAISGVRGWIVDLISPRLMKYMQRSWGKRTAQGSAPFQFAPEAGPAFFASAGWREGEYRESAVEAKRLNREMPLPWIFRVLRKLMSGRATQRWSGIVRLDLG